MQRTNEEELDLFADLLEPVAEILGDKAVSDVFRTGGKPITAIKYAVKNHKQAVVEILARIDGVPVEEYHVTALALPVKLLNFLNKPEVKSLFTLQGQMNAAASFTSATENTEDGAN